MKKTAITISYDEEKLSALKMYLTQRGVQVESELERSCTRKPYLPECVNSLK